MDESNFLLPISTSCTNLPTYLLDEASLIEYGGGDSQFTNSRPPRLYVALHCVLDPSPSSRYFRCKSKKSKEHTQILPGYVNVPQLKVYLSRNLYKIIMGLSQSFTPVLKPPVPIFGDIRNPGPAMKKNECKNSQFAWPHLMVMAGSFLLQLL